MRSGDGVAVGRAARQALALPGHRLALEQDLALLAVLEQVGTAQDGRFA